MSEHVRHKMIDFAVEPPPPAWQSIAERLDDDMKYTALVSKMERFEAPPPAGTWEGISTRLNDDGHYAIVAAKMIHFEAAPPAQFWDKIAAAIPEATTDAITKKTPVIYLRKTLYRAMAAAVIISILVGGWMMLAEKPSMTTEIVKSKPAVAPGPSLNTEEKKNTTVIAPSNNEEATAVPGQAVAITAQQENSHRQAGKAMAADDDRILKYAVVERLPAFREGPIVISSAPIVDASGEIIRDMDVLTTNSNYILVTGPNGQQTRISAKFASVIRYLNGSTDDTEEYLDKVIKESDTWKKRFQEWRSKISQSSFIPSSANFLDIIEFKNLIQEQP